MNGVGNEALYKPTVDYKRARYYHRFASGSKLAALQGHQLRFLTLTSTDKARYYDLPRDIDVFIKRVRRRYKFEYCKIQTNEGNGVFHILYKGDYIPKSWIKRNWYDIHDSYIIKIEKPRTNKGLTSYLVNHYLSNQKCDYTRLSWSRGWLPQGAIRRWKHICKAVRLRYFYNPVKKQYYHKKRLVTKKEISAYRLQMWYKYLKSVAYRQTTLSEYENISA